VSEASRLFRRTFQNEPQVISSTKEASEIAASETIDDEIKKFELENQEP